MAKPTGKDLPTLEGVMFTKYGQDGPWINARDPPLLSHLASILYEVITLFWKAYICLSLVPINLVEGSGEVSISQAGLKQTHRIISNWLLAVSNLIQCLT